MLLVNLARHEFHDCNLTEVDFTEAILIDSTFNNCNLGGAIFDNTHLERADFRTAVNFQIDPASNKMNGAKFSINGLANLLMKYKLISNSLINSLWSIDFILLKNLFILFHLLGLTCLLV